MKFDVYIEHAETEKIKGLSRHYREVSQWKIRRSFFPGGEIVEKFRFEYHWTVYTLFCASLPTVVDGEEGAPTL